MKKILFVPGKIYKWLPLTMIIFQFFQYLSHQEVVNAEQTQYGNKEYKPRLGRKRRQAREPGGYRGNSCKTNKNLSQTNLTLLVPEDHVPLTSTGYPTFFWYLDSMTHPAQIRLTVYEPGEPSPIYVHNWNKLTSGLYATKLPATVNPLEIGKQYRWTVSLICNPDKPSDNIYAKAWIERVNQPVNISNNNGSCLETYSKLGIWYDALSCQPRYTEEFWSLLDQVNLQITELERPLITSY